MSEPIQIVPYDPAWPVTLQTLRSRLYDAVGHLAVAVEHVGSTAVSGLAAKPILDVDVVMRSASDLADAICRLGGIGYVHLGDQGVPGREAFAGPQGSPQHHLYLVVQGSEALRNHVQFRDYLRAHPDKAAEYSLLKRKLALRFRDDRDGYTEGKTEFVKGVLYLLGS